MWQHNMNFDFLQLLSLKRIVYHLVGIDDLATHPVASLNGPKLK